MKKIIKLTESDLEKIVRKVLREDTDIEPDMVDVPVDKVKMVQQALINAGYNIGPTGVDGKFGENTRAAVIQYQKKNGIKQTGNVGPVTGGKLGVQPLTSGKPAQQQPTQTQKQTTGKTNLNLKPTGQTNTSLKPTFSDLKKTMFQKNNIDQVYFIIHYLWLGEPIDRQSRWRRGQELQADISKRNTSGQVL